MLGYLVGAEETPEELATRFRGFHAQGCLWHSLTPFPILSFILASCMSTSPDILACLAKYDTPTICNVIELFEVRPQKVGYMDSRIHACFHDLPPMVGFASTASFRSDAPPVGSDVYGSVTDQLEQFADLPGPAVVVFQDIDDPPTAATFGEVMCASYRAFGAAGLITSGPGRDLDQVRQLKFPVFTGGANCSHAYSHVLNIGLPVHVGGLTVHTGDLLHGDRNGVTTIPLEIASEIPDVAVEFMKAESHVLEYVNGPDEKSTAEVAERIQTLGAILEDIRRRVSRQNR